MRGLLSKRELRNCSWIEMHTRNETGFCKKIPSASEFCKIFDWTYTNQGYQRIMKEWNKFPMQSHT